MEFNKAFELHNKKLYGKCSTCEYSCMDYVVRTTPTVYCKVRREYMIKSLMCDWFQIKFCKYYEEKKVKEENKNVKK